MENKQETQAGFADKVWKPILGPILALVAICIVTSFLLGITNQVTKPLIDENTKRAAEEAREVVLPEAEGFTQMDITVDNDNVTAMYKADNGAGYVFEAYGQGYGGQVPAMIAFDAEGNIAGVTFLENSETPGLGKNLETDPAFAAQFAGLPAQPVALTDIDQLASATISTNAALTAINAAADVYNRQIAGEEG